MPKKPKPGVFRHIDIDNIAKSYILSVGELYITKPPFFKGGKMTYEHGHKREIPWSLEEIFQ